MGTDYTEEIKNLKYWIVNIDVMDDNRDLGHYIKDLLFTEN